MRNNDRINDMKREAIAHAEKLGHKLKRFKKYKDEVVYYSGFCARCSAYLRVTAIDYSGRAVEGPCQKSCHCGQPLTPNDLDGNCETCRGNRLTLYPKTPAVRVIDANFIEYCRKKDQDYEPSLETLSDFFWRCQSCAMRLGSGYQGDPDEQGLCHKCAQSKKIWAKRKADAIEAAGGLKAWQRKRLIKKLLEPVDYVAVLVGLVFVVFTASFVLHAICGGIIQIYDELFQAYPQVEGPIWIAMVVSFVWCALRWKILNARPSDF